MQLSNSWTMSRFLLAMSLIAIIAACSSPTASPSASDKAAPAAADGYCVAAGRDILH